MIRSGKKALATSIRGAVFIDHWEKVNDRRKTRNDKRRLGRNKKTKEREGKREREGGERGFRRQFTEASQYTGNANGEIGESG